MTKMLNPYELPECMIGPSEPCDAFTILQEKLAEAEREKDRAIKYAKDMNGGWRATNFANHDLKAELATAREEIRQLRRALFNYNPDHALLIERQPEQQDET